MATKSRIEEIKEEMKGITRQINNPSTSPSVKKALEAALETAEKELAAEESKSKEPAKPADKTAVKEKPVTATPADTQKKKRGPKPKEKKVSIEEGLPEKVTVTVNGHTETIEIKDCASALRAMALRKARDVESGAKTKSRLPADAAVKSMENMVDHVTDMITDKKVKENPEAVIKAMGKFEKKLSEAVEVWDGIISAAGIAKIKKAIQEVIEVEIKDLKKASDKK